MPLSWQRVNDMAIGKFFKSLLGGASQPAAEPLDYKGFTIEAAPIAEGGKFRTAGFISGELDGEVRRVQFIRADLHGDAQGAIDHAFAKGQQIVDEQGKRLLDKTQL